MPCNDEFRSFCKICDRLVTEYEEVCKEKKSLQLEIEFRLSHQNNDEDNIGADEDDYDEYETTLGIDEDYDENLDKESSVEKGEIEDVSKFMKSNVKIFEIDVKQHEEDKAPESVSLKKEVVITKFKKNKKATDHEQYLQVDPNTWDDIFTKHELRPRWDSLLQCLLQPQYPSCSLNIELRKFESSEQRFNFCAVASCQIAECPVSFSLLSDKHLQMRLVSNGQTAVHRSLYIAPTSDKVKTVAQDTSKVFQMTQLEVEKDLICQYCLRKFDNEDIFREHRKLHKDEEFVCPVCGEAFDSFTKRNNHHSSVHGSFSCTKCRKPFQSEVRLNIHIKQCTFGEVLQCHLCQKTFANKRNLRDHISVIHGHVTKLSSGSKFECQHCGKIFHKKFNLTSHLLRHSSVSSFLCDVPNCGKSFKRERTLMKHYQVFHEGRREKYLCGQCGQVFSSQSGFRTHVALHGGQEYVKRNVKCNVCDKMFRCQSDLKTHMVVHSKERPFICTWTNCDQSFSQKASLRDHLNVHEKKFQCVGCSKAFGRERYLIMHVKTCVHLGKDAGVKAEAGLDTGIIIITTEPEPGVTVVEEDGGGEQLAVMVVEQRDMEEDNVIHVVTQNQI